MFETEKVAGVLIYAFCEWWPVNLKGEPDKNGRYAFIDEVWIHKDYRGNGVLRRIIHKAAQRHPQIDQLYYHHRKHNYKFKQYSRKQLKEEI